MASIDKISLKKEDYILFRNFWLNTIEEQKFLFDKLQWLFPFQWLSANPTTIENPQEYLRKNTQDVDNFPSNEKYPICSSSEMFDLWLVAKCNIKGLQNELYDKYDNQWIGFKYKNSFSFDFKPFILSYNTLDDEGSSVYFFDNIDGEIELYDNLLVYGTTLFLEELYEIKRIIQDFATRIISEKYKIEIDFYGSHFKYSNGSWYNNKEERVILPYIGEIEKYFFFPNINYSLKKKCIFDEKYKTGAIILSHTHLAHNADQFKNFSLEKFNRYIDLLPEYIKPHIK